MIHFAWLLPTMIFLVGLIWYGVPHGLRLRQIRLLQQACIRKHAICLTYDDGPGGYLTSKLLNLLAEHDALATFFLLGTRVDSNQLQFQELINSDHEMATHTHQHFHAWKRSPLAVGLDIKRGWDAVERTSGQKARFRPPYGKLTLAGLVQVRATGRSFGWWTHDSGDTWPELPNIQERVEQLRLSGGGVVLLHDFDENRPSERVKYVLDFTREVLVMARNESIQLLTLSELEVGNVREV